MRVYPVLLAIAVFGSGLVAHADTISTFSFSGITYFGGATATGQAVIDVTTGSILSMSGTTSSKPGKTFSSSLFLSQGLNTTNTYYTASLGDAFGGSPISSDLLFFAFPQMSLVGYAGGPICAETLLCPTPPPPPGGSLIFSGYEPAGNAPGAELVTTGGFVLVSSVTVPEPSSFGLLGTGLIGFSGILRALILRLRVSSA